MAEVKNAIIVFRSEYDVAEKSNSVAKAQTFAESCDISVFGQYDLSSGNDFGIWDCHFEATKEGKLANCVILADPGCAVAAFDSFIGFCEWLESTRMDRIQVYVFLEGQYHPVTPDTALKVALCVWEAGKKQLKRENAFSSRQKALARGIKPGRKVERDDQEILRLRDQGLSVREIAKITNVSTASVQRALKAQSKQNHRIHHPPAEA